jgi:quinol monooxygenase YgiN
VSATSAFVVVDLWRVKPGKRQETQKALAESAPLFRAQPGILSVDYTHLDGDPDRYLVVFRYASREARESFRATDELTATMARLSELWDLESPVYLGYQTGL